jgi:hypothetical protein
MGTVRTFAYNSGSAIPGTAQVGFIAAGLSGPIKYNGSIAWWPGPDEDTGYVICHTSGARTAARGAYSVASPTIGFWKSALKTEASFLSLCNGLFNQGFVNAGTALTWLNANGYWTSYIDPLIAGLYKTTYTGYFADNVSFFATATPASVGGNPATSVQTTSIFEPAQDDGSTFSCQWLGYFKPTTTQTYTFYTSSDDASYVWVGANAISGFTTSNAVVNNGGLHGTVEKFGSIGLTAGTYYPIRIQFGEQNGGDVMTFNYETSTITKTTNVTDLVFYNNATNGF